MSPIQPLPVGVGYGVVVGIGFFFAAVMCGISYIQVCSAKAGATMTVADQAQNRYTRFSTKTSVSALSIMFPNVPPFHTIYESQALCREQKVHRAPQTRLIT